MKPITLLHIKHHKMDYYTLSMRFGFSRYSSNGIQLLPDGRLLLLVSERSTVYKDTIDRQCIEFTYDGHVEGARGSRNDLVRKFIHNSDDTTPRVVLAIGRFGDKKYKPLIWTYDDGLCLRGVIEKGLGVSPEFVISPVFKLEWSRFNRPIFDISESVSGTGPGYEDVHNNVVYVISNPSLYGVVKVGKSIHLKSRFGVLNTSLPTNFKLEGYEEFESREIMDRAEKHAHEILKSYRVDRKKEFFKCNPRIALRALKDVKRNLI